MQDVNGQAWHEPTDAHPTTLGDATLDRVKCLHIGRLILSCGPKWMGNNVSEAPVSFPKHSIYPSMHLFKSTSISLQQAARLVFKDESCYSSKSVISAARIGRCHGDTGRPRI